MPALIKKSITRSISKKWNSIRGVAEDLEASLPYYEDEAVPEAVAVSDTSSDDDSSEDENDTAKKYGYNDASNFDDITTKFPRRLSFRQGRSQVRRRSLICRQQPLALTEEENLPFHPQRKPRRSSLKGSCPYRAARRRASIGTCAATSTKTQLSIEEEIANGAIKPSQILELHLPGRRESIKRRRSIQFNEDISVHKIQPTSTVKSAIKKELWFQTDEYDMIKKKTRALLEKVDSNGIVNGKKYCTRGLEKYMKCPQKRASEKYQALDSVFTEQEMQRVLEIYDDESLGRFYKDTSSMSVVEATNRAALDAQEVASFYQPQLPSPQPQNQHTGENVPERQGSDKSTSSHRCIRHASVVSIKNRYESTAIQ